PGSPSVTDDLAYSAADGKLSAETTSVAGPSALTTTQRWEYNAFGLVAHHYHPRPDGSPRLQVSFDSDEGLPCVEYVHGVPVVGGVRYQPGGALWTCVTGIGIGHDVTAQVLEDGSSLLPRPARILATAEGASTPAFDTLAYSYDGAGNITAMGPDAFSYDSRSRLVAATLSGIGSQAYSYDRYGNLLAKGSTTFCSGTCADNQIPGASYSRGNLIAFGGQTFGWDGLDRMTSNQSSGLNWSYLYNGGGERIAKVPPSGNWAFTIR